MSARKNTAIKCYTSLGTQSSAKMAEVVLLLSSFNCRQTLKCISRI